MAGGRYAVSIEGIRVIKQIPDFYSQTGDRGDNVFISVEILIVDPAMKPQYIHFTQRSLIYGDLFTTSPDYDTKYKNKIPIQPIIFAGRNGKGLKDDDQIPHPDPWIRSSELSRNKLPMSIVDENLNEYLGIAIVPSIWSLREKNDLYSRWEKNFRVGLLNGKYSLAIQKAFDKTRDENAGGSEIAEQHFVLEGNTVGLPAIRMDAGHVSDYHSLSRPIGMVEIDNELVFKPKIILLNSILAEKCASIDSGFGNGIMALEYTDGIGKGSGEYVLYLSVQRT